MSKELKEKTVDQLKKNLLSSREELQKINNSFSGTQNDVKKKKNLKKTVAQILTFINQKQDK